MYLSRVLKVALLLSLLALVIPLSAVSGQIPVGTAMVRDANAGASDHLVVTLENLPALDDGEAYEGWLASDDGGTQTSVGVFAVDDNGNVSHAYTHPEGMNLASNYSQFIITVEPSPDAAPESSGIVAFSDMLPADGLVHLRAMLDSDAGSTVGMVTQVGAALTHAGLAVNSTSLDMMQAHMSHVINIVEGSEGDNFNADAGNPGDGMGISARATAAGDSAAAAVAAVPTSLNFHTYQSHVSGSAGNVSSWSGMARDAALTANGATAMETARAYASNAQTLLDRALNGWDQDRSGDVNPRTGEGGAMQAHMGAQSMASYNPAIAVEAPATGDMNFVTLALIALGIGSVMVLGGGALVRHSRARA